MSDPGRNRDRVVRRIISGSDRRGDNAQTSTLFECADNQARPSFSAILKTALVFGPPQIDVVDDVGRLGLSPGGG